MSDSDSKEKQKRKENFSSKLMGAAFWTLLLIGGAVAANAANTGTLDVPSITNPFSSTLDRDQAAFMRACLTDKLIQSVGEPKAVNGCMAGAKGI